jgi:DNA-directed RNA polymerase specialized sigma24 family protein
VEGLSLRAAAARLGVSRSAVHRAQWRGVEGLREGAQKQRQPAALVPVEPPPPRKANQP